MSKSNYVINKNCLLKVNLKAIRENFKKIKNKISNKSKVAAVLKSNAYGLGLKKICKTLIKVGCDSFFVNTFEEALYLRGLCPKSDIYLLNGLVNINEDEIIEIFKYDISPVLNSVDELKKLSNFKFPIHKRVAVTLHFDTGINRLGIKENQILTVKEICRKNMIKVKCIMSHLIASDEKTILNLKQKLKFEKITKNFPKVIFSLSNSNAINNHKSMNYGMVRSGGSIYGVTSNDFLQSFSLYARVLQIKTVDRNINHFGYNSTFKTKGEKKIAILGVGYADGYPRNLSNKSEVFFIRRLPIIGTISMDYTIIDINSLDDKSIEVGDWVELIGDNISIREISEKSETIPYEILINICSRAKKQYIDKT